MREKESLSVQREKPDAGISITGAGVRPSKVDETRREFLVKAGLIIGSLAVGVGLPVYCSRFDKKKKPDRPKNNLEIMFDAEPVIETAQVRGIYDKGFSLVFEKLGHSLDPSRVSLQQLKEFKEKRVRWVGFDEVAGKRLVSGAGHFTVIPPGNPRLKSQYFLAGVEPEPEPTAFIRPHKISAEFAGLNGIHELRHLYDFVNGVEPKNPTDEQYFAGEVRAWEAQIAAADLLTDGRFSKGIGDLYSKYGDELIDHVFGGDRDPILQSVRE